MLFILTPRFEQERKFIEEALEAAGAALSKRFFRWHRYKFSIDFWLLAKG
jgi:hypothetical protein